MKLELRSIISEGILKTERLTLRALDNLDVGDYLVAQADFVDESPTTNFHHTFWFPFKIVQKGDLVVIYTKVGTTSERVLSNGNKAHFYYLDLNVSIWSKSDRGAVLLYSPTWQSKSFAELKKPR